MDVDVLSGPSRRGAPVRRGAAWRDVATALETGHPRLLISARTASSARLRPRLRLSRRALEPIAGVLCSLPLGVCDRGVVGLGGIGGHAWAHQSPRLMIAVKSGCRRQDWSRRDSASPRFTAAAVRPARPVGVRRLGGAVEGRICGEYHLSQLLERLGLARQLAGDKVWVVHSSSTSSWGRQMFAAHARHTPSWPGGPKGHLEWHRGHRCRCRRRRWRGWRCARRRAGSSHSTVPVSSSASPLPAPHSSSWGQVRSYGLRKLDLSQIETCEGLSPVKGERSQPDHRSRSDMPASFAIRSSSDGHTYRNGIVNSRTPDPLATKWCETACWAARSV